MAGRVPEMCEARKNDLAAMALGEPLGSREPVLRAHLSTCVDCRAYLSAMARTIGAVRGLPRPEPSRDLTARILAAAREAESGTPREAEPAAGESWLQRAVAAVLLAFRRPAFASAVAAVVVASAAVALLVWSSPAGKPGQTGGSDKVLVARGEAPRGPAGKAMLAAPRPDDERDNLERSLVAETQPPPAATPSAAPTAGAGGGMFDTLAQPQAEDTPIMAVVTGVPPAGTTAADVAAPSDVTHVAIAQRPPPAPDETTQTIDREQAPAAASDVRVAEDGTQDGDSASRFRRGVEITAEVAARDAAENRDRAAVAGGQTESERNDREEQANLPQASPVSLPVAGTRVTVTQPTGTTGYYADEYREGQPARPTVVAAAPPPPPPVAPSTLGRSPSPAPAPAQGFAMSAPPAEAPQGGEGYPEMLGEDIAGNGWGGMGAPAAQGAVSTVTATGEADQGRAGGDQVAQARERLATGEAAEAEALLEDALRTQESRSADVTFLLAETYARQGKWSAAARTYDLFLARYLDDPRADEARWRAADAYRRTGAVTRAAALLQQLVGVPGYDSRARASLDDIAVETAAESTTGPAVDSGVTATPAAAAVPAENESQPASPP